jgi:hypothetical protein
MHIIELLYVIRWITLGLALCATAYKMYAVRGLHKRKKLAVSMRFLSFYSDEQIYSTNTPKKREVMIFSNWATAIMLACLIPNVAFVLVNLALKLVDFMDTIA